MGVSEVKTYALRFYAGATDAYGARGLAGIRPGLGASNPPTPALPLIDFRWPYRNEAGQARQHTSYRYLLRRTDAGQLGIQVVVDTTPA